MPATDRFKPGRVTRVRSATARALLDELTAGFVAGTARAEGLDLWRHAGGPWEADGGVGFRPDGPGGG